MNNPRYFISLILSSSCLLSAHDEPFFTQELFAQHAQEDETHYTTQQEAPKKTCPQEHLDADEWVAYCKAHNMPYTTPIIVHETFLKNFREKKAAENKIVLALGAGTLFLGMPAGVAIGVTYNIRPGIHNYKIFTGMLPIASVYKLSANATIDTAIKLYNYKTQLAELNQRIQAQGSGGTLSPKTDCLLLVVNGVLSNLIDHAPLPKHNQIYSDKYHVVISQNQLLRAAKESGKEIIGKIVNGNLSINRLQPKTDAFVIDSISADVEGIKKMAKIIAINSACEIGYGTVSRLMHVKVAPEINNPNIRELLHCAFPSDGTPKDPGQEITRTLTIGTLFYGTAVVATLTKIAWHYSKSIFTYFTASAA
jgi:hypothetical protein